MLSRHDALRRFSSRAAMLSTMRSISFSGSGGAQRVAFQHCSISSDDEGIDAAAQQIAGQPAALLSRAPSATPFTSSRHSDGGVTAAAPFAGSAMAQ